MVALVQSVLFLAVVAVMEVVLPAFTFIIGSPDLLYMVSLFDLFSGVLFVGVAVVEACFTVRLHRILAGRFSCCLLKT